MTDALIENVCDKSAGGEDYLYGNGEATFNETIGSIDSYCKYVVCAYDICFGRNRY